MISRPRLRFTSVHCSPSTWPCRNPRARANAQRAPLRSLRAAGLDTQHVDLTGDWWAAWQTWQNGRELVNTHQVRMNPRGDTLEVTAVTRGTQSLDQGGYLWRGELRVWDNEVVMGWYVAPKALCAPRAPFTSRCTSTAST
jgi:hypothetical protein